MGEGAEATAVAEGGMVGVVDTEEKGEGDVSTVFILLFMFLFFHAVPTSTISSIIIPSRISRIIFTLKLILHWKLRRIKNIFNS